MEIKGVWAVYFSPVGGTETVVTAVAAAAAGELGLPVKYVGLGEGIEDLRPFDAKEYVEALI